MVVDISMVTYTETTARMAFANDCNRTPPGLGRFSGSLFHDAVLFKLMKNFVNDFFDAEGALYGGRSTGLVLGRSENSALAVTFSEFATENTERYPAHRSSICARRPGENLQSSRAFCSVGFKSS